MLEEFKQCARRGNLVALALAIIFAAAFGALVRSLVGDIFRPIIGAVSGGLDFSNRSEGYAYQQAGALAHGNSRSPAIAGQLECARRRPSNRARSARAA